MRKHQGTTRSWRNRPGCRIDPSLPQLSRSEPEPDLAILRPREDYYASRHAGPADILLLLEIAEWSIDFDRDVKLNLYARSGVHEYWILDLNEDVLTCVDSPAGATCPT